MTVTGQYQFQLTVVVVDVDLSLMLVFLLRLLLALLVTGLVVTPELRELVMLTLVWGLTMLVLTSAMLVLTWWLVAMVVPMAMLVLTWSVVMRTPEPFTWCSLSTSSDDSELSVASLGLMVTGCLSITVATAT